MGVDVAGVRSPTYAPGGVVGHSAGSVRSPSSPPPYSHSPVPAMRKLSRGHLMTSLWSPSVMPLIPTRPLMNSNLTASNFLATCAASSSNSSTDI